MLQKYKTEKLPNLNKSDISEIMAIMAMPNKMGFTFACMALILDNFKDHHEVKNNTAVVNLIKSADNKNEIDSIDKATTDAIKRTLLASPHAYINAIKAITEQFPTDVPALCIKEEDRQLI